MTAQASERDFRYCAFFCEENAWLVAADPRLAGCARWVVIVTNRSRQCPVYYQRAQTGDGPVVWDYHVFVVARWPSPSVRAKNDAPSEQRPPLVVFDLDTTLGLAVPLTTYVQAAFQGADQWARAYRPLFRVVPAEQFLTEFASDRRHMLSASGEWTMPPPPWPPIQGRGAPHDLHRWLDLDAPDRGRVVDVHGLVSAFGD